MPYSERPNRSNPGCILFLIDQSASMNEAFGKGEGKRKADGVAEAINILLDELVTLCTKGPVVRDYFYIGVIGYGPRVGPAFSGYLAELQEENPLIPISKLAEHPAGITDDEMYIWFEPVAENRTPMCEAIRQARLILEKWVHNPDHLNSYPPIVINLTDGAVNDGDPTGPAETVRNLTTNDGNTLLFNCHISSQPVAPILYPSESVGLPDEFAKLLFEMSSILPDTQREAALSAGLTLMPQARGFVFNAGLEDVFKFIKFGTKTEIE